MEELKSSSVLWAPLPGIPGKMKWPVIYNCGTLSLNRIEVYCRADDAMFAVKASRVEPFSYEDHWTQTGIKCLTKQKKKKLLLCFNEDLKWAKERQGLLERVNVSEQSQLTKNLHASETSNSLNTSDSSMSLHTSEPSVSFHTSDSSVSIHTSEPSVSLNTSESSVSLHTSEPSVSFHTSEPSVSFHTSDSSVSFHTSEPSVSLHTSEPSVSFHTLDSSVSLHTSEPSVGLHTSEPSVSLHTSESSVSLHTSESSVGLHTSEPSVSLHTSESSVGIHTSEPSVGLNTSESSVGLHTSESSVGLNTSESSVGLNTSESSVGLHTSESSVGLNTSESSVGLHTSESSVGLNTSESSVGLHTSEPSVSLHTSEPSVSLHTSEPSVSLHTSESSVGLNTSESSVGLHTSESSVGLNSSDSSAGIQTSEPSVGLHTSEPSMSLNTSDPSVGLHTSEPSVSLHTSDPSVSLNTSESSVGLHTSESSVGLNTSDSSAGIQTSEPSVGLHTSESSVSLHTSESSVGLHTLDSSASLLTSDPSDSLSASDPSDSLHTSQDMMPEKPEASGLEYYDVHVDISNIDLSDPVNLNALTDLIEIKSGESEYVNALKDLVELNSCESDASDLSSTVPMLMSLPALKRNDLSNELTTVKKSDCVSDSDFTDHSDEEQHILKKIKKRKSGLGEKKTFTIHYSESEKENETLQEVRNTNASLSCGKRRRNETKEERKIKKRKSNRGEKRKRTIYDLESEDNQTFEDDGNISTSAGGSFGKKRRHTETEEETHEKSSRTQTVLQEMDSQNDNLYMRDPNNPGLYIKKYRLKKPREHKGQSRDTRIYDNTHACFFCGKIVLHISEHLKTHRTKEEVKEVMEMDSPNFTSLRKLGDDKHNRQCLEEGEGEIILSRRPKDYFNVTHYGPCPDCREWVLLKYIKHHNKECTKRSTFKEKKRDLVLKSQVLAGHVKQISSLQMLKEVFPIMTSDETTKTAKSDPLIVALGESWLKRNCANADKRKYYASSRMRLCARFLTQLKDLYKSKSIGKTNICEDSSSGDENSTKKDPVCLWDFLKPQHFGNLVLAALRCSYPDADDSEELLSPSNAIKLKYDLHRLIDSKWGLVVQAVGNENCPEAQECNTLLSLMDRKWKENVTDLARSVLNRRKFDEKTELPSPEDIERITKYLTKELLQTSLTSDNFTYLVMLLQTRLLLYNKRRTGELEVIKLQSYASRSCGLNDVDASLTQDLTEVEKVLMKSQDLMKIRGKRGRPVPVLIPPDCKKSLAFIASATERKRAKILEKNQYLFPNSVYYYARAYESLKTVCSQLKLSAPHRITSVSMRKYTATLTQMLNLNNNQMDWVCDHLGHTRSVHKEHYRQMSGLLERTQISKLLLIQDLNLTAKFKGKNLEEMDIRDIVFQDDYGETDVPDRFSLPDDTIDVEERIYSEEAEVHEEEDDKQEEDDVEDVPAKTKTRKRWTVAETDEIKTYFKDFLSSGTTPRADFINKMKEESRKQKGFIHLRENHLIIKKISNMNHAKRNE